MWRNGHLSVVLRACFLLVVFSRQFPAEAVETCTQALVHEVFTPCEADTNTKTVLYYFSHECTGGGIVLPDPIYGIPCNISCVAGEYLKHLTDRQCSTCAAGSYSLGGGFRFDEWNSFDQLVKYGFKTYCEAPPSSPHGTPFPCNSWNVTADGHSLQSGDNRNFRTYRQDLKLRSFINARLQFVRDGYVKFTYRVDSEPWFDGMDFFVDKEPVWPRLKWNQITETYYRKIPQGYHLLDWVYFKDFSQSGGSDRAYLESLEVDGIGPYARECIPCAPGLYSKSGDSVCIPCPMFTYTTDGITCAPCPADRYSFEGATECVPRPACHVLDDMTAHLSTCNGTHRRNEYTYTAPKICMGGDSLPEDQIQECSTCDPGSYRQAPVDGVAECAFCEEGAYITEEMNHCTECPAGTEALRLLHLKNQFSNFTEDMETGCSGLQCNMGWRAHGMYLDSGIGHGYPSASWLRMKINMEADGTVQFQFAPDFVYASLAFLIDDKVSDLGYYGLGSEDYVWSPLFNVTEGDHELVWRLTMRGQPGGVSRNDLVRVGEIIVVGSHKGGAESCTPCLAGHVSDKGSSACTPCPPGTEKDDSSNVCIPCPSGTFTSTPASLCHACGNGTTSSDDGTGCVTDCKFDFNQNVYDLRALNNDDNWFGPLVDSDSQEYFLDICQTHASNNTCVDFYGKSLETRACQMTSNGYSVDIGSMLSVGQLQEHTALANYTGLQIRLDEGGLCDGEGGGQVPIQTVINLICDRSAGRGEPTIPDTGVESTQCEYHFDWRSIYGCRVCDLADIELVESACQETSDGQAFERVKQWVYKPHVQCREVDTFDLARETTSCDGEVTVNRLWIYAVAAGGFIVLVILLVLVVSLGMLMRRHREVTDAYTVLRDGPKDPVEMEETGTPRSVAMD